MSVEFYYQLPSPIILNVVGRDAERYLQARLTNNIKKLTDQGSCLAACLTPQGKTEALFRVYKRTPQEFVLLAFGGDAESISSELGRFIVSDRVEIKNISDIYRVLLLSPEISYSHHANEILIIDPYLQLQLLITDCPDMRQLNSVKNWSKLDFDLYRAKQRLPEFPDEIKVGSLFPESGVELAISNTKGCYAGQEVVERVFALGKCPAKIIVLQTDSTAELAEGGDFKIINTDQQRVGEVLTMHYDSQQGCYYLFVRLLVKGFGVDLQLLCDSPTPIFLSLKVAQ